MDTGTITAALSNGPLLGKDLYRSTGISIFELWRTSHIEFEIARVGNRYLRFDRNVDGYARMSPAIEREFSTYSVIGLKGDTEAIASRARSLEQDIKAISSRKMRVAENSIKRATAGLNPKGMCCVIGGDVPLGMAHDAPRPEKSTGKLVAGSDLDLVVIVTDAMPENSLDDLDERLYKEKFSLLKNPHRKEELDYLVKRFSRVKEQARFDSFESMVACKILNEGKLLYGDAELYESVIHLLDENAIPSKLVELKKIATVRRHDAEEYLLKKGSIAQEEYMKLFTTSEEFGEIF
ncbi:MAG: hypothetical protein V3V92_04320 [Candidatus Hydrothermarchaeales archaeon]